MDRRLFNPLYTLRYDTAAGEVVMPGLLRSEIHLFEGPKANRLGEDGAAWDIAVLDEDAVNVTGGFPCFT